MTLPRDLDRRRFLRLLAWAPALLVAVARTRAAARTGRTLPPTPDCGDDDEPTPPETEGPFFKPRSPKRTRLIEPGMPGTPLEVSGRVYSVHCKPIANALLDFWHADDSGEYDNDGFRLRGHQYTDAEGRWRLVTIVPGLYPGRTRHIHVKVQAPHGHVLTTQLYFPGEPRNREDDLYRSDLQMAMGGTKAARTGRFHFVLEG